jgi:endonuclease I
MQLPSPRSIPTRLQALALVLVATPLAAAQAPTGYYSSVDASSAASLRSTLHAVVDDHQRFPYTSSSTDTWDILELAEQDPANASRILSLYRNATFPKQGGGNSLYNREHVWPTSLGFPSDDSQNYPYTDCHALRLVDPSYNSARSNKPFRYCDPGCEEWTTDVNDGAGGGSGSYPGQSSWTSGFGDTGTWEAWAGRRGDVARVILYLDVRYEGGQHGVTGVNEPDLIVTNDQGLISASNTGQNESVAYMGILDVLLEWHASDPVDARELARNDVVYSFQGNRNPFIDHPEWVDVLWGNGGGGGPTGAQPWINEFHYDNGGSDVGEFVEIAGPAGLDLSGYRVLAYNGSNGADYDAISLSGTLPDLGNCIGALAFDFPGLQNGSPDALALVDAVDNLIEFLSYEGTLVATTGPAFGQTSVDVGVAEDGLTAIGEALARTGTGQTAADFTWSGPQAATPGGINGGQTFTDACGGTGGGPPAPPTGLGGTSCAGAVQLAWNPSTDPAVTGYRVWRSNNSGIGFNPLFSQEITATTYLDASAASGATVYYAVTALSAGGESSLSAELQITVQGGGAGSAGTPWINEFHYDNSGTDAGEFVEVAGPGGMSLAGWTLVGYNGASGDPYNTISLSGNLPNGAGCVGAAAFDFTGLQNGSPDAIALVDPQGAVVEFLSYEGILTGNSGPAAGLTSVDVGVIEDFTTPIGYSIQRTGSGASAAAFTGWSAPGVETPGAVNTGQTFQGGCSSPFVATGCGINPADSLVLLAGEPVLGTSLTVGVDNPLGTQTVGSLTFLIVSTAPDPAAPCGTPLPGFGMSGPFGELLVSIAPGVKVDPVLTGPSWAGPGTPAPIDLALPFSCGLAGLDLWLQGIIVDPFGPRTFGLTEGRKLTIAP